MNEVPVSYLRDCFILDPDAGTVTWRVRPQDHFTNANAWSTTNTIRGGKRGGTMKKTGYLSVCITLSGTAIRLQVHRIIWAMHTGAWPAAFIDHINGDKSDNRACNLREAAHSQNLANTGVFPRNKFGLKGVSPHGLRYRAQIKTKGKVLHVGVFDTPEQAHAAYCDAARKHHGEFAGGLSA